MSFFYLLLGELTGSESLATLGDDTVVNALTCVAFVALATWITYRGVEATKRVQYVLVGFQSLGSQAIGYVRSLVADGAIGELRGIDRLRSMRQRWPLRARRWRC